MNMKKSKLEAALIDRLFEIFDTLDRIVRQVTIDDNLRISIVCKLRDDFIITKTTLRYIEELGDDDFVDVGFLYQMSALRS